MEAAAGRVGIWKASSVLAFMVAWDMAERSLGDEWPADGVTAQLQAYRGWWNASERTSWRELQRFRECFPGEVTPSRLMGLAREQWDTERGLKGLGAVQLAGV